jgi:hypothetical protein
MPKMIFQKIDLKLPLLEPRAALFIAPHRIIETESAGCRAVGKEFFS